MPILIIAIHRHMAIIIMIPGPLCNDIEKISKFLWSHKTSRIDERIMNKNKNSERISVAKFELHH